MSNAVIQIENLWKEYRLGVINHHTLTRSLQSWWARVRGKEDPNSPISPGLSPSTLCPLQSEDRFWALQDVSFVVNQGDILGIIGRNGAGKSTLLKILSQVTAPTKGEVRFKGRIASLLEVGTGFHPELTGRENIFLNGAILGMSKADIRDKLDEIIAFAEVDKFIDTPVKRYSSGMYVRLAFAVAAHLEPEILIVDEVLAVGDAQFQKKCLGKMEEVSCKDGRTVLFVSHNMQAVRLLCQKAILLDVGRIAMEGEAGAVIERYLQDVRTPYVTAMSIEKSIKKLPHDPDFKLNEILITQEGKPVLQTVENGKPLEISLRYHVFERTTGLRVFIDLFDDQGTLLFRSFHDEDNDGIPTMYPGNYVSKVVIPPDWLAPRFYELKVFATIYNIRYFFPDGITIPLQVERTGRTNRAYLSEPIHGRLAPWLQWETETVSTY